MGEELHRNTGSAMLPFLTILNLYLDIMSIAFFAHINKFLCYSEIVKFHETLNFVYFEGES